MKKVEQMRRIQPELQRLSLAGRELSGPFQPLAEWEYQKIPMDALPPDAIRLILRDFIGGPTNDLLSLIRLAATPERPSGPIIDDLDR